MREDPDLKDLLDVIGEPLGSVVSFKSSAVSVYALADHMNKKGWHLNALQRPAAIHIAVTRLTVPVVDEFLTDLKATVCELKESNITPESSKSDTTVLYGVAGECQDCGCGRPFGCWLS